MIPVEKAPPPASPSPPTPAYKTAVVRYLIRSPHNSFEWARSLPTVPSSDEARFYIASSLLSRGEDRPKAMELISQFSDTGKARANLRRLAARWLRMDAASARTWIESPNLLTPEDKARLFQKSQ